MPGLFYILSFRPSGRSPKRAAFVPLADPLDLLVRHAKAWRTASHPPK
jgi:hypothetical protein